jgi:hypothetical protein
MDNIERGKQRPTTDDHDHEKPDFQKKFLRQFRSSIGERELTITSVSMAKKNKK